MPGKSLRPLAGSSIASMVLASQTVALARTASARFAVDLDQRGLTVFRGTVAAE